MELPITCTIKRILAAVVCLLAASNVEATQPAETAPRSRGGLPDFAWVDIYFDRFDRVVASAGLESLRSKRLSDGQREIRVWIGGGIGYPQSLYRITADESDIAGQVIWYWPVRGRPFGDTGKTFQDLMRYNLEGSCRNFALHDNTGTCQVEFERSPDWEDVLDRAEQSGLTTLPDASTLPTGESMILDGWTLTVELLTGETYRTYHYNNPQHRAWPEAEQALRVARVFQSVDRFIRPPEIQRRIHGTVNRFDRLLHPCDGGQPWHFRSSFDDLLRPPHAFPETMLQRYEVTLRAVTMAPWLARLRGLDSERTLQAIKVLSIKPAPAFGCSNG